MFRIKWTRLWLVGAAFVGAPVEATAPKKESVRVLGVVVNDASLALILYGEDYPQYENPEFRPFERSARWLQRQLEDFGFPQENIICQRVTSPEMVEEAFEKLKHEAAQCSAPRVVVAYIGHGVQEGDTGYLSLKPDSPKARYRMEALMEHFISLEARHKWLIVDACYSGSLADKYLGAEARSDLLKDKSAVVWLSSAPQAEALTGPHKTKLIEAIGAAIAHYYGNPREFGELKLSAIEKRVIERVDGRFGALKGGYGRDLVLNSQISRGLPSGVMGLPEMDTFIQESVRQREQQIRKLLRSAEVIGDPQRQVYLLMELAQTLLHREGEGRKEALLEAREILENEELFQMLDERHRFEWNRSLARAYYGFSDFEGLSALQKALAVMERMRASTRDEEFIVELTKVVIYLYLDDLDASALSTGEHLEEGLSICKRLLKDYTQKEYPQEWARVQAFLGTVHKSLARLKDPEVNLQRALEHYTRALEVFTQKEYPQEWAAGQLSLGGVYQSLAHLREPELNLQRAVKRYNNALQVFTQKEYPLDWAAGQLSLGAAYKSLAHLREPEVNLQRAVEHYTSALQVFTQKEYPREWAGVYLGLGIVHKRLSNLREPELNLQRAAECYTNALQVFTPQAYPEEWAMARSGLGAIHVLLAALKEPEANLQRAVEHLNHALQVYTQQAYPREWAETHRLQAAAYAQLYGLTQSPVHRQKALESLRLARDAFVKLKETNIVSEIEEMIKLLSQGE